ncbi:MAG: DivIVA domain-containing protein [Nitrospira sp.]|nr:DivIVA domain-containing protein [Nitrospira sp.]MBA3753819.1 DivIVA domain-containing protein [Nitrospira sp.]
MKITPIDIQQMVFQVKFRGYDRDEVNRFLEELALTVENLNRDNSALRDKLSITEQQVSDLRRTESTLSNTLVSAQTLAEDVKRSAQRESDLIVKEAELKGSEIIRQARVSLADMQRSLSDLQKQRLMMVERFRSTLRSFERMLEVEESDAYQSDSAAAEGKLAGESSSTR